jgi:preprotein translocase subunit Sec61beta
MLKDLYSKKAIETKKISKVLTEISATELSKQLGLADNRMVNNACKKVLPNKVIENGIITYFTEEEATIIISYIKKQSNRTDLETLHTSLKGASTSKSLYGKNIIQSKKVSEILKQVSTTELAKQLHTTNDVILSVARKYLPNKIIKNGVITYWDEQEATTIIQNIQYDNPMAKAPLVQVKGQIKTSILIKENFLKATQDYIALIEEEKKQLQETNEILLKQKSARDNIVADRCDNQKLFADLNKAIRKYAILNNIANPVAYRYFYDKLCAIHCFTDKLTMEKLKKYPKYAKELLDIVLLELKM